MLLLGRICKEVEIRYSQATEPVAVAKYTLAVNKRFKKQGEPDADFINCITFKKNAEFAEKYFVKGQQISVVGSLSVRSWEKDGVKHWTTEVIVDEQYFADSKGGTQSKPKAESKAPENPTDGFYPVDEEIDDEDLPF